MTDFVREKEHGQVVATLRRRAGPRRRGGPRSFPLDRRLLFRDLHIVDPDERVPSSPLIQFYSSSQNIGNYLPVAGIHQLLGIEPDTWCMHHEVDFDFVNANYQAAVIGGAGLFHVAFEPFWRAFAEQCHLPVIIWGVGICVPDGETWTDSSVSRDLVAHVAEQAVFINVRDDISAEHYELEQAHISPCPTVAYLSNWRTRSRPRRITLSIHPDLATDLEHKALASALRRLNYRPIVTNNVQGRLRGLGDIIRRDYSRSAAVVTTRLHGAIIAYGLGLPYVAYARDQKIRAFHRLFGNGIVIEGLDDLNAAANLMRTLRLSPIDLASVVEFSDKVKDWLGQCDIL